MAFKPLLCWRHSEGCLRLTDYTDAELLEKIDFGKDIQVKRLKYSEVVVAIKSMQKANVNDPIWRYIRDSPDSRDGPVTQQMYAIQGSLGLASGVRHGVLLTVDGGHAVAAFGLPGQRGPRKKKPFDVFLGATLRLCAKLVDKLDTDEQKKRMKEVGDWLVKLVTDNLGEAAADMVSLDAIATHPDYQRRGWGGALADTITAMGDKLGKVTYVLSSNVANDEFYQSHGFHTIATALIGEGNHTWKGPTIPLQLMIRQPKSKLEV